jgi:glyoxylase-like metal-dependent hydrolase (beta-lactamase superfamily II)
MTVRIFSVPLGVGQAYILKGEGTILIDGGTPGKIQSFLKGLEDFSIAPEEIKLIVLTHGHWDHVGSAKDIRDITRAKTAMHELEKFCLEESVVIKPPGAVWWGRVLGRILKLFFHNVHIPASRVDITLGSEDYSLHEFGIPGRIIHTPGHSPGSVSVLLDTGEAFVGDLAMNAFPLRCGPGLPIFADDLEQVKQSWRKLLDQGAAKVYPAHGKPFLADVIRRIIQ